MMKDGQSIMVMENICAGDHLGIKANIRVPCRSRDGHYSMEE